jgi:hypothetical protein
MEKGTNKASEFIERNSIKDGELRRINVNSALLELFARYITLQEQVKEIQECLSYIPELEERISKLEGKPKIEVVSELQSKILLGGK